MQFIYTVSSFLHIMIRHNVDFCKNEPRFMPVINFHLNCILLLMMKMNKKQFLFQSWKIRAEGQSPLNQLTTLHGNSCKIIVMKRIYPKSFCTEIDAKSLVNQTLHLFHLYLRHQWFDNYWSWFLNALP